MDSFIKSVEISHPQKKILLEKGYLSFVTREGVLMDDELWVHPATLDAYNNGTYNHKYIFVFKEQMLNSWSSTQTMRRYKQLAKSHIKLLDSLGYIHERTPKIRCSIYNEVKVFNTRKEAIAFFKDCMEHSEGSECNRYTQVYLQLLDGHTFCTDYDITDSELKQLEEHYRAVDNKQSL